jgi:hypothetical protein
VDPQGRVLVCEAGGRRVTRTGKDGVTEVLADNYEGKKFNSPNDVAIDSKGRIYFSDPRYGSRDGMEIRDDKGQTIPPARPGAPTWQAAAQGAAALAGLGRAAFDQAVADNELRSWILQQQQADQPGDGPSEKTEETAHGAGRCLWNSRQNPTILICHT